MSKPRRQIPEPEARQLRRLTRRIRAVRDLEDQRGALMASLHDRGYSFQSIAEATNANEEGIRRAINRWRSRATEPAQV